MKINIPKQWFEEKIALEGDCEIGAGNPHFGKKLTWADKVRKAYHTNPELQKRIHVFNAWKSMAKRNPEKYRITHFARSFTLEECIVVEAGYMGDDSYCKWVAIDKTPNKYNTIWWYIWNL